MRPDSDTPSLVVAEIFQKGPLYRTHFLGSFQQNRNTNALIVEFNRLVMQDGTEVQISAYAIDGTKGLLHQVSIAVSWNAMDLDWPVLLLLA